jgi:hypothetical protein
MSVDEAAEDCSYAALISQSVDGDGLRRTSGHSGLRVKLFEQPQGDHTVHVYVHVYVGSPLIRHGGVGKNNPAQGDCTTNSSEAATSVGSVLLIVTPSSFEAEIQLRAGYPNTTYAVLLQQVPGSCPQSAANGGTLTTDSSGRGHASTTVPRVLSASTFFVQLAPVGSGAPSYTSDRISGVS